MKITKEVREEAAMLCGIVVSPLNNCHALALASMAVGATILAEVLAIRARHAASIRHEALDVEVSVDDWYVWTCAEAEAMLRTGWKP